MIKKTFIVALVLCAFSIQSNHARAATLSFDPSSQFVGLGDAVTVDLRISDLGDDILTGFDLDISFDDTILGFTGFDFGTGLDSFLIGANIQDATDFSDGFGSGLVNVFELSFDSDSDLMIFQPNDFVLGTFSFDTLSLGTSALDISFALLSGEFDDFGFATELQAVVQSGSVSVVPPAVIPIPAAIWLFGTGLVGLIGFSKQSKTFVRG